MSAPVRYFSPAEAASRLGVSAKALRLYEQSGLVTPVRSEAGWRAYGPDQMARAGEIASLRALGFSLAQVARVLNGDAAGLEPALAPIKRRLRRDCGTSPPKPNRSAACGQNWPRAAPRPSPTSPA